TGVAKELADITGRDEGEMEQALDERENEASTAITPEVAIPHVILEGENLFHLVIVRCKDGISFTETHDKVNTVFVLAGTLDERNFHLQALSAIAQIVLRPDFYTRWMGAHTKDHLRDILHLSERQRFNPK
ncbi:MAG: PTS sugar transporter subunit IIA, partial [Deltaproteobacteria bacterium]|nr:PTS sugar transporter subunit IIA [Deltaproteobacteria bacterium]